MGGCILGGETKEENFVGRSKSTFNRLFEKMKAASEIKKMFIEIVQAMDKECVNRVSIVRQC